MPINTGAVSADEEAIARHVVAAAYAVHRELGPGLLESIYETCFCYELTRRKVAWKRQLIVPIVYHGIHFDEGLRLDVLADNLVICELKAVDAIHPVHVAQLLTQLKLTDKRLGFVINFNVAQIKIGIKRIVR
jgi:GxxExxY protein